MALPRIAWIGTGVMGRSMAGHLLAAGHPLVVHTRSPDRARALLDAGAAWAATPRAAAEGADVACAMVGLPTDVEGVFLGPDGILAAAACPRLVIDFTTSSPALARRIAEKAAALGAQSVDAPVSGGDVGARNAALSIMCGGSPEAFESARPLLARLGKTIVRQGGPGAGQHAKMVNQILIAGTMLGLAEALTYARKSGLDPATVLESVGGGAAASWSLANLAPRVLKGDFAPGFFVEHFVKDLRIALDEAQSLGLDLRTTAAAERAYAALAAGGHARSGTQAIVHAYGW
jgi:3-hydroxyisobutyrate dehydrogenase